MPVEPTKRIAEIPLIKRKEESYLKQRRRPKQPKQQAGHEGRKVDLTV